MAKRDEARNEAAFHALLEGKPLSTGDFRRAFAHLIQLAVAEVGEVPPTQGAAFLNLEMILHKLQHGLQDVTEPSGIKHALGDYVSPTTIHRIANAGRGVEFIGSFIEMALSMLQAVYGAESLLEPEGVLAGVNEGTAYPEAAGCAMSGITEWMEVGWLTPMWGQWAEDIDGPESLMVMCYTVWMYFCLSVSIATAAPWTREAMV